MKKFINIITITLFCLVILFIFKSREDKNSIFKNKYNILILVFIFLLIVFINYLKTF